LSAYFLRQGGFGACFSICVEVLAQTGGVELGGKGWLWVESSAGWGNEVYFVESLVIAGEGGLALAADEAYCLWSFGQ
jgi:hypothetical protein